MVVVFGVAGEEALWFAMPITELIVAIFVVIWMVRCTRQGEGKASVAETIYIDETCI